MTSLSRVFGLGALAVLTAGAATAQQPPPAAAAQSSAPAAPAATPPLPNRLNSALPAWLRVRGEFRERLEGFDGLGFNSTREDLYWLSRFRFNATVTPSKHLSFMAQVQDARVAKKTVGPTQAPFRAPFDLRQAFADIGAASGPVTIRAGRQELVYGDQRLVGHVSWLNAARTFDGGKVTIRSKAAAVDVFAASVVRILPTDFDKSGAGNRFAGAYLTTTKLVKNGTFEPYVFWKRDVNQAGELATLGTLQHTTFGLRMAGRLPGRLDYNLESAGQRGTVASQDIAAWATHWQLRESLPGAGAVKLTGEFNMASGDDDPADGRRGTFDQLYPTPHDKTGLADQIGWRNLRHVRAGLEFTPVKATPVTVNYHSFWLTEKRDGLYGVNSALQFRVPAGADSAHIGQEIDVQVSRAITPQLQVAAGYAHIYTGAFLKQVSPGASYSHPYLMATYVFLAER